MDPYAYQTIHKELTESCRSLADTAADGPKQTFYRNLEDLAQPWLTLSTLAKADREILVDLLIRCRQAERKLKGRHRDPLALRRAAPVLLASAVIAVLLLSAWSSDGAWSRALDDIHSLSIVIWFALRRSSGTERLFLMSIIIVSIYMYFTYRAARS